MLHDVVLTPLDALALFLVRFAIHILVLANTRPIRAGPFPSDEVFVKKLCSLSPFPLHGYEVPAALKARSDCSYVASYTLHVTRSFLVFFRPTIGEETCFYFESGGLEGAERGNVRELSFDEDRGKVPVHTLLNGAGGELAAFERP